MLTLGSPARSSTWLPGALKVERSNEVVKLGDENRARTGIRRQPVLRVADAAGGLQRQDALERALSEIAGETVSTICAGRTDAGVHALGQVVHFETSAQRPLAAWVRVRTRCCLRRWR